MAKLLLCSRPQQLSVSNITTTYTPITKEVTLTLQDDTTVLIYISAFVTFSSGSHQANMGIQDVCDNVTKKYSLPGVGHASINSYAPFSGWMSNISLKAGTHRISIVAGSTDSSKIISVSNAHAADIVIFGIC